MTREELQELDGDYDIHVPFKTKDGKRYRLVEIPPADATAEEIKQAICKDIDKSLRGVTLKRIKDDDDDNLPLVDLLSTGDTIASGWEEIEHIVEQIYFDMDEWRSLASLQPQPTAEGAEEILDSYLYDYPWQNWSKKNALAAMQEFATLHAQKIADKMVSERLREYHHSNGDDVVNWKGENK